MADKQINEKDFVKVINETEGHQFEIGSTVQVIKAKLITDAFLCSDGIESWWLNSEEIEKV